MSALIGRLTAKESDVRRHRRVRITVLGRYMLADQQENACQTIDLSPGGIALIASVRGAVGERVVCYFDHFGRLEGRVVRWFHGGFAIELMIPAPKREKLADQLTWHANRNALGVPEGRHHSRLVPRRTDTFLRLPNRRIVPVVLMNVSISGAALTGAPPLEVGTPVCLGRRSGRVARLTNATMAVEFVRLIPREEFDDGIEL